MRLKLKVDDLLSSFAFKFSLRRYNKERAERLRQIEVIESAYTRALEHKKEEWGHELEKLKGQVDSKRQVLTLVHLSAQLEHFLSQVLGCLAGLSDENGSG